MGFAATVSEERKSWVGSEASLVSRVSGLTSKQPGHPPELEFSTLDERRAAVQAAVALSAELFQGHPVTFDLAVAEGRGAFVVRVLSHPVAERSDEFHPSVVQHPKPDGHRSRLVGLALDVHGVTLLEGSQLLLSPRGHF